MAQKKISMLLRSQPFLIMTEKAKALTTALVKSVISELLPKSTTIVM